MAKRPRGSIDTSATATSMSKIITPEQLAASGTEHGHQAAIFQWIAITGKKHVRNLDLLFAVPNGGERSQSVAASLKAEGVRKGIPDMCLPVPSNRGGVIGRPYPGLWLELKKPGLEGRMLGGRSPEQQSWHVALLRQGYAVATAYGWQASAWVLWMYLNGQLVMPDETGDCFMAPGCAYPPVFE